MRVDNSATSGQAENIGEQKIALADDPTFKDLHPFLAEMPEARAILIRQNNEAPEGIQV